MLFQDIRKIHYREIFSREKLMEFTRAMAWVAPLTLLIWIYAEREQIKKIPDVTFSIQPRVSSTGRLASISVASQRTVTVELEGPAVKLDGLRQQLLTGLKNGTLPIDLDSSVPVGPVSRRTVDLLNEQSIFSSAGVKVIAASPPQVTIQVDELVTRELIVAPEQQTASFETQPVFDPPTVKITGPRRLLEKLSTMDPLGRLVIRPDFQQSPALKIPGTHEMADLPLIKPAIAGDELGGELLDLSPDRVKTTFRIRQADVTYTIPAMPVFPLAPTNLLEEYKVTFEPLITNVTVQGPPALITALKNDTLPTKPKAILEFTREDLITGKPVTRKLRFDLPEGLTVSPEDQKRELEFTLTLRTKSD